MQKLDNFCPEIDLCLITPNVEKIQKRMLLVVAEVFGNLIFSTYDSFKNIYSREELVVLFNKSNILKFLSPALNKVYIELTKHLIEEEVLSCESQSQLTIMIDNVIAKMIVFPKGVTRIYIFNACMQLGIAGLSKIQLPSLTSVSKSLTIQDAQEAIIYSCFEDYRFIMNYYPKYETPVLS